MKSFNEMQLKTLYQNRFPHLSEEIYTDEALNRLSNVFQSTLTKRLTWNFLAHAGHLAFGLSFPEFQKPTRSHNERSCKPQAQTKQALRPLKKAKIYDFFPDTDSQNNTLVPPDYPSNPTTPKKPIYQKTFHTPTFGREMHLLFSNPKGKLLRILTPKGDRETSGRISPATPPVTPTKAKKPLRLNEQTFTVTLDSIQTHANIPRWPSQKQLTGTTAKAVLKQYDAEHIENARGVDCHWSHLIGYFLGGKQTADNLFAGTAASNYNTLEIVERRVYALLTTHKTSSVTLKASPRYEKPHYAIPCEIEFQLTWQEANATKTETIYIHPLSFRRMTDHEKGQIERLREGDQPQPMFNV